MIDGNDRSVPYNIVQNTILRPVFAYYVPLNIFQMKHTCLWGIVVLCSLFCFGQSTKGQSTISVVPKPNQITVGQGTFAFKNGMAICAPAGSEACKVLSGKLAKAAGIVLGKTADAQKADIVLSLDKTGSMPAEGYSLNVSAKKITVDAATETGLYYGVQTLLQLLPPQIESNIKTVAKWAVPCVAVNDAPRFSYRGIHLDCCRHFLPVGHIKKFLDMFAMYKINRFHWHLTEDQAWRIEIKRYPKLTSIGSVRTEYDGTQDKGFYTQEQIKEIVKYAADRHIEVIPEIEMPGHALAALTAYPEYSCTGGPFRVRNVWGVEPDVYCAGNEQTYTFLSNILDEVCKLFPSPYIHIGGDECPKDRWKVCPKCQALMKAQGLKNENELQSYFTKRMEKILEQKGKKIIGWDEILEGGIAPSATVMSWRGEQGGIDAANAGHDVIMTPGDYLYIDHYQGDPNCESVKIGGLTTLQTTYEYDPVPKSIATDKAHHVLGLQGNLWSEYLYTPDLFDYQLFPRLTAIAETGWTDKTGKNTDDFVQRIDDQQIRWDKHGINYYIPMPEGNTNFIRFTDQAKVAFTTNRPVKMVYTLDGTIPTGASKTYTQPLTVDKNTTLKIRSVLPQGKLSNVRTLKLTKTQLYGAQKVEGLKPGLKMRYTTQGKLWQVAQLQAVKNMKDTIVTNVRDFFKLTNGEQPGGAAIFTGYIYVEKTGQYAIHCVSDRLYLNGNLVIDNNGKIKKNAQTDLTMPLEAGYHPVKIILLNRISGGVPSSWLDGQVTIRPADVSASVSMPPTKVFYR
jgi:hexosaminidase